MAKTRWKNPAKNVPAREVPHKEARAKAIKAAEKAWREARVVEEPPVETQEA